MEKTQIYYTKKQNCIIYDAVRLAVLFLVSKSPKPQGLFDFEVRGTQTEYQAGKPLETKRIGKENPRIEKILMEEAETALRDGHMMAHIFYEV